MIPARIFTSAVLIVLFVVHASAQVPNGGFESWSGDTLIGWATSPFNVTPTSDAHSGSFAVYGTVIQLVPGTNLEPVIQTGADGRGFAYSQRPLEVTGWYKFTSVGGDRFGINVQLFKGGVNGIHVASAASGDSTGRVDYTQFVVRFTYLTSDVPDTCIMQFLIFAPAGAPLNGWHVGSAFTLDDVSLSGATDVPAYAQLPSEFRLEQNYPNPFNPSTVVSYQLSDVSNVKLVVYDLLGREITTLAEGVRQPGSYVVRWDASEVASGTYFIRMQAGAFTQIRKVLLIR